jgi:hypothetical protein
VLPALHPSSSWPLWAAEKLSHTVAYFRGVTSK